MRGSLFRLRSIDDYVVEVRAKMCAEIDRIPDDEIRKADAALLAAEFAAKYQVECPILGDDISIDPPSPAKGNNPTTIQCYVPFSGNHELFQCSGRSAPVLFETINVQRDQLVIPIGVEKSRVGGVKSELLALLKRVEEGLKPIAESLKFYNPDLKQWAERKIRERQADIASHSRLLGDLEQTGFAVRRRNDGNEKIIIPVKPTVISVQPRSTPPKTEPQPELLLADYDEILRVIRSMVRVFERSPSVFKTMEEEHLRTILLVALNGLFKGNATGETFNGAGKTDILIRVGDNNIFIAECLIWGGPDHFRKKLTEQLFLYSTWHDSKIAAIVFNRNKDFTAVVQKMKDVVTGLGNRIADLPCDVDNACRATFRREDDTQKRFVLTCMAFEVSS